MGILSESKSWKPYNLVFLVLGLFFGAFLYSYEPFHAYLLSLGSLEYVGAFLAGLLYDSTITVATSIVLLLVLAEDFPKQVQARLQLQP